MISSFEKLAIILLVFIGIGLVSPLERVWAGYSLTDRDGRVLSEDQGGTLVTGPTNQTIILNDQGNRKIFEIAWDATGMALVVKGDNVHLKIHSSGKVEKWSAYETENKDRYPIILTPVVPGKPRK